MPKPMSAWSIETLGSLVQEDKRHLEVDPEPQLIAEAIALRRLAQHHIFCRLE
jgi:hypothetical protein